MRELTPREKEVIHLRVEGRTNREVAAELEISQSAIEMYVRRVMAKTGTRSVQEAAIVLGMDPSRVTTPKVSNSWQALAGQIIAEFEGCRATLTPVQEDLIFNQLSKKARGIT